MFHVKHNQNTAASAYCNKNELEKTDICGCFYCKNIFYAGDITEWTVGPITAGAIYSVTMVIIGAVMLIYIYTRKK